MAWPAEGALQWRTLRATLRNRQPLYTLPSSRPTRLLLRRQGQPAPQPASPFATINTRTPATSGPVNTTANGFTTGPVLRFFRSGLNHPFFGFFTFGMLPSATRKGVPQ